MRPDLPEFFFPLTGKEDRIYVCEYKRRHRFSRRRIRAMAGAGPGYHQRGNSVDAERIFLKPGSENPAGWASTSVPGTSKMNLLWPKMGFGLTLTSAITSIPACFWTIGLPGSRCEQSAGKRVPEPVLLYRSFQWRSGRRRSRSCFCGPFENLSRLARRNVDLNTPSDGSASFAHADANNISGADTGAVSDLIVLDPPTFSNSKRMDDILDIQRDHVELIQSSVFMVCPLEVLIQHQFQQVQA